MVPLRDFNENIPETMLLQFVDKNIKSLYRNNNLSINHVPFMSLSDISRHQKIIREKSITLYYEKPIYSDDIKISKENRKYTFFLCDVDSSIISKIKMYMDNYI